MTRHLLRTAREHADGRCALVLEGGYDLDVLRDSVASVLDELGGENLDDPLPPGRGAEEILDAVIRIQKRYWNLGTPR